MPSDASEGKGPQRRPQRRFDRRLEAVAKAVGGGYCRLQMPLRLALGVRGRVAGHRLGALEGGVPPPPLPMHPWLCPSERISPHALQRLESAMYVCTPVLWRSAVCWGSGCGPRTGQRYCPALCPFHGATPSGNPRSRYFPAKVGEWSAHTRARARPHIHTHTHTDPLPRIDPPPPTRSHTQTLSLTHARAHAHTQSHSSTAIVSAVIRVFRVTRFGTHTLERACE